MATADKEKVLNLAKSQVGYKESGQNITKYSSYFDTTAWQWFNGKKQGVAWCAIWICWLFCQAMGKNEARTFLGCPSPKNNCAAGVKYLWQYMTGKGYKVDKKKGQAGDVIFFSNLGHVGIIEKVENGKYYTIEGNKSNAVKRCNYSISSSSIYGICHPKWSAPAPQPTPTPTPTPTPKGTKYRVTAKSGLNIRSGPGTSYKKVGALNYGATCTVYKTQNGWGKISESASRWVCMAWLKKV